MTFKELSEKIGLTQTGLQGIFKNNSTSIDTLRKIAQVFNLPIEYFFSPIEEVDMMDTDGTMLPARVEKVYYPSQSQIAKLEKQVEDKERLIFFIEDRNLIELAITAEKVVRLFKEKGMSPTDLDSLYEIFFKMEDFDKAVHRNHVRDPEMIKRYEEWGKRI